jgi:hypothetical protein
MYPSSDIPKLQEQAIEKFKESTGVTSIVARALLIKFNWSQTTAID